MTTDMWQNYCENIKLNAKLRKKNDQITTVKKTVGLMTQLSVG